MPSDPAQQSFKRGEYGDEGVQLRVRIEIDEVLPRRILRKRLMDDPILSTLQILKQSQGTNFKLTEDQATALAALAEEPVSQPFDFAALPPLIERFRARYGSFTSELYLAEEREYKLQAAERAEPLLHREGLLRLIEEGRFEEAKQEIKRVYHSNNLLNQWDVLPIVNAPAEQLTRRLYDLLYGDTPFEARFNAWVELLSQVKANCWPAATFYLMMHDPTEHIFVKPTPFNSLIDQLDLDLEWDPAPSAWFYAEIQRLAWALLDELASYGAQDMIDVQTFTWHLQSDGDELPSDGVEVAGPRYHSSTEEWQASIETNNAIVRRIADDYPGWLLSLGERVSLQLYRGQHRLGVVIDGRVRQDCYFNRVWGLYAAIRDPEPEDITRLREKLSNPASVLSRLN